MPFRIFLFFAIFFYLFWLPLNTNKLPLIVAFTHKDRKIPSRSITQP